MATNLAQFNQEVLASNDIPKQQVVELQRRQVLSYVEIVGTIMPYKTGHMHANVVVSIGAPIDEENEDEPLTTAELIARAEFELVGLKFGDVAYVNFNAPYTSFVNNGTSRNAAAGFVEAAQIAVDAQIP